MAEDKDTPTPKQEKEPTRRVHIPRVVVVMLLVLLIASSIAGFFLAGRDTDNQAVLWGVRIVAGLVTIGALWRLIRIGYDYQWTGLGEAELPKQENVEFRPKKTLWDWLQLLIVPLALAAIGFLFTVQQDARQQAIEDQRAEREREIEEQRAQDAALQAYLDQMSQLMLQGDLRGSEEGSEVRTLAGARTQTVLARLDGRRKGSVVRFLYEANLIDKEHPVVSLSAVGLPDAADRVNLNVGLRGADLRGLNLQGVDLSDADPIDADLRAADLSDADLSGADLRRANLRWAILSGAEAPDAELTEADLHDAYLSNADLSRADLSGANMNGTTLRDANLREAFLIGADLSGADLSGANLSGANLSGAKGVTEEELEEQAKTLEGATMPNGSIYD